MVGAGSVGGERLPRGMAAGVAADPLQSHGAVARHRRHRGGGTSAAAALPRRGRDRRARAQRALLRVRLPAHGHDRPHRPGVRARRCRRAARGPLAAAPARRADRDCAARLRPARRPRGHGVVRALGADRRGARELSAHPPPGCARGPCQHGAPRLAARSAERARADGAPDRHQRPQHRAGSALRPGLRLGGARRRDRHRVRGVRRHRARPLAGAAAAARACGGLALAGHPAGRRLSPPARGQPRHHAAQPQPGSGVPRLHRAELAPGRDRARGECRAPELPDLRRLRSRRLRPCRRGHGRTPRRPRRRFGLSRRHQGQSRPGAGARGACWLWRLPPAAASGSS